MPPLSSLRSPLPGLLLLALAANCTALDGGQNPRHGAVGESCQVATLRNEFTVEYSRSETLGAVTRLWLCAEIGTGYVEIPSDQIQTRKQEQGGVVSTGELPREAKPARSPALHKTPEHDSIPGLIASVALQYKLDPDFITSVVRAESGFNPAAVSPKGARGLMQLMPGTAAMLGINNVFDPKANLQGGTRYLRQLLDQYDGDSVKALAAYNAGPQRVQHYGGTPPFRETQAYIAKILNDYKSKKDK